MNVKGKQAILKKNFQHAAVSFSAKIKEVLSELCTYSEKIMHSNQIFAQPLTV